MAPTTDLRCFSGNTRAVRAPAGNASSAYRHILFAGRRSSVGSKIHSTRLPTTTCKYAIIQTELIGMFVAINLVLDDNRQTLPFGTTPLKGGGAAMVTGTGRMRHATGSRVLLTRPGAQTTWTRPPHSARIRPALPRGSRGAGTSASIVRRSGATAARPAGRPARRHEGQRSSGCTIRSS